MRNTPNSYNLINYPARVPSLTNMKDIFTTLKQKF